MQRVGCHLEQCVEVQGCEIYFPTTIKESELDETVFALIIERIAQAKLECEVFITTLFSTRGFSPKVVRNRGGDIVVA
jgi:hypothetical protein